MRRFPASIFLLAGFLAAPCWIPALAHCPVGAPAVEMEYPSPGVSVQKACYQGFEGCFVDTFHVDSLRQLLKARFSANRYAAFAYVDSVRHYQTYDSIYSHGKLYYIDTFQTEDVYIGFHSFLKDSLPTRRLTLRDRWMGFVATPLATTYLPLVDTPFVAFFNGYDSLWKLGIGPMDGCFFEPTGFFIYEGRVHKKGLPGDRMPGISLTMEEFYSALGLDPVPVPPVSVGPRAPRPGRDRRGSPATGPVNVDARGRRIPIGKAWGEWLFPWD